jgi:hypothetical protein
MGHNEYVIPKLQKGVLHYAKPKQQSNQKPKQPVQSKQQQSKQESKQKPKQQSGQTK